MKRTLAVSAIAAFGFATPAFADTMTRHSPLNWAGPYIGVNVGYGWGNARTSSGAGSVNSGYGGFLGGGQIGYNFQAHRLVFGVETDLQASGQSGTVTGPGVSLRNRLRWFGTTRARIGADLGPFLPYATAGLAYGDNKATGTVGPFSTSRTRTHLGWAAGAGLEFSALTNISLRGEYLYTDLRRKSYGNGISVRPDFHAIRFGVNIRF